MEEWNGKEKDGKKLRLDDMSKIMEDSLMEKDLKRKEVEPPKGRKSNRRKLAKVEGWVEQKIEDDENLPEG